MTQRGVGMAKKVTSRKRTVMQDVHPDVADHIEDFTDPDRIEAARARLLDYSKVAEQFASDAGLPEEEDELDVDANDVTHPVAPAQNNPVTASADDLDLLADLEKPSNESEPTKSSVIADSLDDFDDDDLDEYDNLDLSTFREEKSPTPDAPAHPIVPSTVEDDFDLSDLDTDLMDDEKAGDSAFGRSDLDDDDDDIFGIGVPSAVQEPTPYGNKSSTSPSDEDESDYDFPFDDDISESQARKPGSGIPTWMIEEEDDVSDVLDALNNRSADADGEDEEETFVNEPDEVIARKAVRVPASSASLDDIMGIDEEGPEEVTDKPHVSGDVVGDPPEDATSITEDAKTKRHLFSFGSKKNKNKGSHEMGTSVSEAVTQEERVTVTDEPKRKRGLFGKRKVFSPSIAEKTVSEDVTIEKTLLGDEEETVVTTTQVEGDGVTSTVKSKKVIKKRNPLLRTAASVVALSVMLGGGYFLADYLGFFQNQAYTQPSTKVVSIVPNEPEPAQSTSDTSLSTVEEGLGAAWDDVVSTDPVPADSAVIPDEDLDAPITVLQIPDADPNAADDDENHDLQGPEVGSGEGQPSETTDLSALDDLYSAGKSETDLATVDQAVTLEKVVELTGLLEAQKSSLDSALDRLRILETVIADKDEIIAAAQAEANDAQAVANQARDMAMAQNNVLIEVVGIQDKMKIAEELIVDLSRRTAAIESDNAEVEQIEYLNERIKELTKHMALLSRTVVSNARNLEDAGRAQAAADRAHSEAQAAVDAEARATVDKQTQPAPAGSSGVYGNEKRLMTTPTLQDGVDIPADVKVGDELPVYGKVLDISPTEDGGKLVVMENSSKVIPKQP